MLHLVFNTILDFIHQYLTLTPTLSVIEPVYFCFEIISNLRKIAQIMQRTSTYSSHRDSIQVLSLVPIMSVQQNGLMQVHILYPDVPHLWPPSVWGSSAVSPNLYNLDTYKITGQFFYRMPFISVCPTSSYDQTQVLIEISQK